MASEAEWRALVEKELEGVAFEKALVSTSEEGLGIQPLYVRCEAPRPPGRAPGAPVVAVAPRHDRPDANAIREDISGGATALWLRLDTGWDLRALLDGVDLRGTTLVVDAGGAAPAGAALALAALDGRPGDARPARIGFEADPIAAWARNRVLPGPLAAALDDLGELAAAAASGALGPGARAAVVSTLPWHAAGADSATELGIGLATALLYLRALVERGLPIADAAAQIGWQVAVGRDTFGELCKLRAARLLWHKALVASGAAAPAPTSLHAVCSSRTVAARDPWVNMLRVTTQCFAAILGGADLVTPTPFDEALAAYTPLGRRLARNTPLVLLEESHLGRVADPAAGSAYLDSRTDALARAAWSVMQELERDGGVAAVLASGRLHARLDAAWQKRAAALRSRKLPVLGVSEFPNLDEELPARAAADSTPPLGRPVAHDSVAELVDAVAHTRPGARLAALRAAAAAGATLGELARATTDAPAADPLPYLLEHREAEPFEALRARAQTLAADGAPLTVLLSRLGPPAEHRARVGFARAFFPAAGLRTVERDDADLAAASARVACICGSDERYAAEAAARARALRAAGARRVLCAGRPGALESELRAAGVDGFIALGADAAAALAELLEDLAR